MKVLVIICILSIIEIMGVHKVNANQTLKRKKRLAVRGINGNANFDDFRFTVSIEDWSKLFLGRLCGFGYHICGGSILTPKFVLTAAHCIERQWFQLPRKMKVRAGSVTKESSGSLHDIVRYIEHKDYRMRPQGFDIALLELKTDIEVTHSHAQTIPMVDNGFVLRHNAEIKTAGWGRRADGTYPEHLQSLELEIIRTDMCNDLFYRFIEVVTGEFCAQSKRGHVLDGDSGGPVIIRVGNEYRLAGIVVRGQVLYPDIFTDVAHFRGWIDERIK